jgi:hypothetical protein
MNACIQVPERLRAMAMASSVAVALSCGGNSTKVETCEPEGACSCTEGMQRDTACVCVGGSSCSISGDSIEFSCDGNANCSLSCGDDCLITCPGTTTCTVDSGDDAVVICPGTATCDVTCRADCTVDVAGNASVIVRCLGADLGATCTMTGCSSPTDCGDGISTCRQSCP